MKYPEVRDDDFPSCAVCGQPVAEFAWMTDSETWSDAGMEEEDHCHIVCLEGRLRRPLDINDFPPDIPLNQIFHFAYRMGMEVVLRRLRDAMKQGDIHNE